MTNKNINKEEPFDWSKRTCFSVLDLPFIEGLPTKEKVDAFNQWVKAHKDVYANKFVKMYHSTDPSLPIESEGLKPTSTTRRRSYQSESGFIYLANTPERAHAFGMMGNGGRCTVYEVVVLIRKLLPDKDQIINQRSVGKSLGDTLGDSVIFGGGLRIKGALEPWQVRKFDTGDSSKPVKDAPKKNKSTDFGM